jgi:hypothetical protein
MSGTTALLPFQPTEMSPAQLAAVSYLARYSGHTHRLYAFQLRRWFTWCEHHHGLDPLQGIQRAHIELYIRQLGESGLMDSSVVTMMHAVRGFFRFAHIDGLIVSDPAVYARLPRSIATSPAPRDWTDSSSSGSSRSLNPHRSSRRAGLPARHQRPPSVRSRRRADRGPRREPPRPPRAAPGRQGQ